MSQRDVVPAAVPWGVKVEKLNVVTPNSWRTTFFVGVQSFILAELQDDEDAEHHCRFIGKMFLHALKTYGGEVQKLCAAECERMHAENAQRQEENLDEYASRLVTRIAAETLKTRILGLVLPDSSPEVP